MKSHERKAGRYRPPLALAPVLLTMPGFAYWAAPYSGEGASTVPSVVVAGEVFEQATREFNPPPYDLGEPFRVLPYRVEPGLYTKQVVTDPEIDDNFGTAYRAMRYDLEGRLDVTAEPTRTVLVAPDSREMTPGESACYSFRQLGRLAQTLYDNDPTIERGDGDENTVFALVMGSIANRCVSVNYDGSRRAEVDGAAASASHGVMIFQHDSSYDQTNAVPVVISHETGHEAGLGHVGEAACESSNQSYDPRDPALREIAEILGSGDCEVVKNGNGSADPYAGDFSVMGDGWSFGDSTFDEGIIPAFSTLDRTTLFPDSFRAELIKPEPNQYELSYGENKLNSVKIMLPDNHPLRSIVDGVDMDQLVVALEVIGGGVTSGEEFKSPRRCDLDAQCKTKLYATSSTSDFRVELPSTLGYVRNDMEPKISRVMYLDERLNIGLVEDKDHNLNVTLRVVDYKMAVQLAAEQKKAREELYAQYSSEDLG